VYFYEMIVQRSFLNPKELYFINKGIFYVLIVYFVTLSYVEVLKSQTNLLSLKKADVGSRGYVFFLVTLQALLFFAWGMFKKQKYYDVAFTEHDNMLFVGILMVVALVVYRPLLRFFDRN
jgi:hypothetical protein